MTLPPAPKETGAMFALPRTPAAALLLAALALPALAPQPAHALFGGGGGRCDPTDNDRTEATRAIRAVNARIDAAEAAIVEALGRHAGQTSGYVAQSAKVSAQAIDAQARVRAQTAREVEEAGAVRSRLPTRAACAAATGMRGLGETRRASESAAGRADRAETGRIVSDRAATPAPGAAADASARFREIAAAWCSPARSGDPACSGPDDRHAADMRPATLFDARTIRDPAGLRAAVAFSRNVAAPVVADPPAAGAAETDAERRRVLMARAADARAALATDLLAHLRALRAPGAELGAWADAIAPGAAPPGGRVSRYEILETLASRRLETVSWAAELQGMGADNLLRAVARLLATSLVLQWESFRLAERSAAVGAARLAIAVEETRRLPGLATPSAGAN